MITETIAPAWMHEQITPEEYDSWTEEQCAGIEIVDGMVAVSPERVQAAQPLGPRPGERAGRGGRTRLER